MNPTELAKAIVVLWDRFVAEYCAENPNYTDNDFTIENFIKYCRTYGN